MELSGNYVGSEGIAYKRIAACDLPEIWNDVDKTCVRNWKVVPPKWGHSLHRMMSRVGSFPPSLAHYLVVGFSKPGDLVFDPFCGKGTTVLQAVIDGRRAIGIEVSPEAVVVARAKVSGVDRHLVEEYIWSLREPSVEIDSVPDSVRAFFHDDTLIQILRTYTALMSDLLGSSGEQERLALFVLGCLLGILHGHSSYSLSVPSSHAYAMAPSYVRRYVEQNHLTKPNRNVRECLAKAVERVLRDGAVNKRDAAVALGTAEDYSSLDIDLKIEDVDLIVTSPPYLQAQTYAKDAWLRLWLLGFDYRTLLKRYIQTSDLKIYKQRIGRCVRQMLGAMRVGGNAFLVAGDVPVRRKTGTTVVSIAHLIAGVAEEIGYVEGKRFQVVELIDDVMPLHSRYNSAGVRILENRLGRAGDVGIRFDRILHMTCIR